MLVNQKDRNDYFRVLWRIWQTLCMLCLVALHFIGTQFSLSLYFSLPHFRNLDQRLLNVDEHLFNEFMNSVKLTCWIIATVTSLAPLSRANQHMLPMVSPTWPIRRSNPSETSEEHSRCKGVDSASEEKERGDKFTAPVVFTAERFTTGENTLNERGNVLDFTPISTTRLLRAPVLERRLAFRLTTTLHHHPPPHPPPLLTRHVIYAACVFRLAEADYKFRRCINVSPDDIGWVPSTEVLKP